MANRVKLNNAGFQALRRDPGIVAEVNRQAEGIAARANSMAVEPGAVYRALPAQASPEGTIALATTSHYEEGSVEAMLDQAKHDTLLKAVGA